MKKSILVLMILAFAGSLKSQQMYWLSDMESAKSVAKESGKLIVMDFWASWCGPCNQMDSEVWQNKEMQKIAKNFVGLKINVDNDKTTTVAYNAMSIPKLVIMTVNGETIWETVGYRNADYFLKILNSIPVNSSELNAKAVALDGNKKDAQASYLLGVEFQKIGKDLASEELRNAFLNSSGKYFSKAQKLTNDASLTEEAELYSILNDVYYGKAPKALKKIEKLDSKTASDRLTELRHFVKAKCYKSTNDQDNFQKEKALVTTSDLLSQL